MTLFTIHNEQTAPEVSKPLLAAVKGKYGLVPNILASMAEAPNALKAYLDLSVATASGSLNAVEQQVVQITVSRVNHCHYCVAAHSTVSEKSVPASVLDALKNGKKLEDGKLEALRQFTLAIVEKQGFVGAGETQAFLNAGYSKAQIIEVVLSVTLKTFSNYFNHIADTPVDQAFKAHEVQALKKSA